MRYDTWHCFTTTDLYDNVDPAKWNITKKYAEKHGAKNKRDICGWILTYFFYLVFLDIIKNNITFVIPVVGNRECFLYVKCIQDELFEEMYSQGSFAGIDPLLSEFKGYQIFLQWQKGVYFREKPVYISKNIKHWFYSQINNGKQYY